MENKTENLENKVSKKKIMIISGMLCILLSFSIGIFVGNRLINDEDDKSIDNNNDVSNNVEIEDNNNANTDDEQNNNVIEEDDVELDDEYVMEFKKKMQEEGNTYILNLDPLNKNYSCNDNIIDTDCIGSNTIINTVLDKISTDNMFTDSIDDDEALETKDFASFSTVKKYVNYMFNINNYSDFPDGDELGRSSCINYEKMDDGYQRIKSWVGCSFGAHGIIINNKWHSFYITEENYFVNKNGGYIEVPYYYLTGNNPTNFDEFSLYCTDSTKTECVKEDYNKLEQDKLTKVRYNFSYDDGILTFKYAEVIK